MIEVKDLTFSYDKKPFIEKMNFSAKSGEIFGFLGCLLYTSKTADLFRYAV